MTTAATARMILLTLAGSVLCLWILANYSERLPQELPDAHIIKVRDGRSFTNWTLTNCVLAVYDVRTEFHGCTFGVIPYNGANAMPVHQVGQKIKDGFFGFFENRMHSCTNYLPGKIIYYGYPEVDGVDFIRIYPTEWNKQNIIGCIGLLSFLILLPSCFYDMFLKRRP